MKKIISLIGIIAIMLSTMLTAYAGDVPEALSYEDDAKIFIGTLKDFKLDSDKPKVLDIQVLPTRKIKGDVEINELQTYKMCHFGKLVQKEKEYLFGWLSDDSVWAYEIISYDEKEIKIETYDEFAKRIQDYLDEGLYTRAEQERATIGQQISLAEFLNAKPISNATVKKVTLRYQDELHEVDVDEFEKLSKEIMIVNAKNVALYEDGKDDAYKTVLYIELLDENEQLVSMAAVSRFGEVDRYGLMMSRLMNKDYEMKTEDLQKLYSLFPKSVQKNIVAPEEIPVSEEPLELPDVEEKNYTPWLYGGAAAVFVIAFLIGIAIKKRRG